MSLPSRVGLDPCVLANKWKLDPGLAEMLVRLERFANVEFSRGAPIPGEIQLWVISGHRSEAANRAAGGAPNSIHLECPSRAVDLRIGNMAASTPGMLQLWQILGGKWQLMGGRWGGNFSDPDPNHFDIGRGTLALNRRFA